MPTTHACIRMSVQMVGLTASTHTSYADASTCKARLEDTRPTSTMLDALGMSMTQWLPRALLVPSLQSVSTLPHVSTRLHMSVQQAGLTPTMYVISGESDVSGVIGESSCCATEPWLKTRLPHLCISCTSKRLCPPPHAGFETHATQRIPHTSRDDNAWCAIALPARHTPRSLHLIYHVRRLHNANDEQNVAHVSAKDLDKPA